MSRASLAKDPSHVSSMFDQVAPRYDRTNDILSMGQDRIWRRAVTREIDPRPGMRVLDLGAGTGTSSEPLADAGADVVPADFSEGMLAEGRRRRPDLPFTHADAMDLPFEDASFDVVTISFALRNVADPAVALREMARVTRPGGRLVLCEFSTPTVTPFRTVYERYLMKALPAIASKVSSNPESYHYLAESIEDWPDQLGVRDLVASAGWADVRWRNLTGGVVALHTARRPQGPGPVAVTRTGAAGTQESTPAAVAPLGDAALRGTPATGAPRGDRTPEGGPALGTPRGASTDERPASGDTDPRSGHPAG